MDVGYRRCCGQRPCLECGKEAHGSVTCQGTELEEVSRMSVFCMPSKLFRLMATTRICHSSFSIAKDAVEHFSDPILRHPLGLLPPQCRLTPSMYTNGINVYKSVYRYRAEKNGIKLVSLMEGYLGSLRGDKREGVEETLRGAPDVVVEK